jgi:hypothetical protein
MASTATAAQRRTGQILMGFNSFGRFRVSAAGAGNEATGIRSALATPGSPEISSNNLDEEK